MKIVIQTELDGVMRPGVLTDRGGVVVAVFADRTIADGAALGRIQPLQGVCRGDRRRIARAGFDLGPRDTIRTPWAGPAGG